jgi:hypothetical protein
MRMDALANLLARIGAANGAPVLIDDSELERWPADIVVNMKAKGLLASTRPASSVVCPGCERQCTMPVHAVSPSPIEVKAFVVCDKRSDINRVNIPAERLRQWRTDGEAVANLIAELLGLRSPEAASSTGRWDLGVFKGIANRSYLVLHSVGELTLSLAGHSVAVADVLERRCGQFVVDRRTLLRLVDTPAAGTADLESTAQRRERLRERVRTEKAKGTKAFLRVVAAEEGFSVVRLKQLVAEDKSTRQSPTRASSTRKKSTP